MIHEKKTKSSINIKWNELLSKMWKEVKTPKFGSGVTKKMSRRSYRIQLHYYSQPITAKFLFYLCGRKGW